MCQNKRWAEGFEDRVRRNNPWLNPWKYCEGKKTLRWNLKTLEKNRYCSSAASLQGHRFKSWSPQAFRCSSTGYEVSNEWMNTTTYYRQTAHTVDYYYCFLILFYWCSSVLSWPGPSQKHRYVERLRTSWLHLLRFAPKSMIKAKLTKPAVHLHDTAP